MRPRRNSNCAAWTSEAIANHEPSREDHPDAVTYRRAAEAFRRRDLQALAETIHENVTWHLPGSSWLSREIQGRDALVAYLREIMARTARTFVLEDVRISGTDHQIPASDIHWDLVYSYSTVEWELGGQNGVFALVIDPPDHEVASKNKIPTGQWFCMQWEFNYAGADNSYAAKTDGVTIDIGAWTGTSVRRMNCVPSARPSLVARSSEPLPCAVAAQRTSVLVPNALAATS